MASSINYGYRKTPQGEDQHYDIKPEENHNDNWGYHSTEREKVLHNNLLSGIGKMEMGERGVGDKG
jgi:hypothetical protein